VREDDMSETPDEPDELATAPYVVTCETSGCGNEGHPIPITAPEDNPYVVCGVCGNQITNVEREAEPR
jgi:hypothetical protein